MPPTQTDFLIVTPLAEELNAVLDRLPNPKKIPSSEDDIRIYYSANLPLEFANGTKSQYSIVVLPLAKMGETEAASATSTAVHRWQPRYILLVGIAGGIAKAEVSLGDILISEQVADYEVAKITDKGPVIRWQVYRVDQRLLIAAQNFNSEKWKKTTARRYNKKIPTVQFGPICTGNKIIADSSLADQLREVWAKLIGVEMEASGVANAASQSAYQLGFFMIRGVSDLADGNKSSRYVKRWRPYACEIAAAYTVEFLKSGPVPARNIDSSISKINSHSLPEVESSPTSLNSSFQQTDIPEGTMDPESIFYIERPEDKLVFDILKGRRFTVIIKGPRQVGKSSLLVRAVKNEEDSKKRIALLDFQLLDNSTICDQETFFRRFCSWISDEIGLMDKTNQYWKPELGPVLCCTRYISRYILPASPGGLLIAIDESERIFGSPFRSDFFGMLRAWHNKRRKNSIWDNLSLLLVTSTEPNMFVTKMYQSPFNVGTTVTISDFTFRHIRQLNECYGAPLSPHQEQKLMQVLGGQPYLTHLTINLVASRIKTFDDIIENSLNEASIFANHLQKHLINLQTQKELVMAFDQIIKTESYPDEMSFVRLSSAGLVIRKNGLPVPRCELYSQYFKDRLNA